MPWCDKISDNDRARGQEQGQPTTSSSCRSHAPRDRPLQDHHKQPEPLNRAESAIPEIIFLQTDNRNTYVNHISHNKRAKMSEYRSEAPQPPKSAAYEQPENPANTEFVAGAKINDDGSTTSPAALRGPGDAYDQNGGVEWGMGRGERGHDPVDERERENTRYVEKGQFASGTDDDDARATVADASQVEGKVADAVEAKHGTQRVGGGTEEIGEQDFASDLDR